MSRPSHRPPGRVVNPDGDRARVLAALAGPAKTVATIVEATGLPESKVTTLLKSMRRRGHTASLGTRDGEEERWKAIVKGTG